MNTSLLLFLVLLCFPTQPFYTASAINISGSLLSTGKGASDVSAICDFYTTMSGGRYNCSSLLPSAVTTAANTDDTMPDVSANKFIIKLSVGSGTTQSAALIIDTTLDYTFMLCKPCTSSCSTDADAYNPSLSSTFSNYTCRGSDCPNLQDSVSCSNGYCMYNYTDSYVSSVGPLGTDMFKLISSSAPLVFGCGDVNSGNYGASIGYLGLGSGGLSLLSQTNLGKFSYCFGSSGSGAIFVGSGAQLRTSSGVSTDLLKNQLVPMFHYVNFTGLSLGGVSVDIPSNAYLPQQDGTGGMVLSSTSPLTYLETSAYSALKLAFVQQMSSFSQVDASTYGLDLCFAIPAGTKKLTIPQLTLHFVGADMSPKAYSYFETFADQTVGCLLLLPIRGISILGYYMQYDTQMIYDVSKGVLQFESISCSSL